MRVRAAVLVASAVLVAACSTTVPGTPGPDPLAVPRPDTGSEPTAPRTLARPNSDLGAALEGRRMAATAPVLIDIDPAIRYNSEVEAGKLVSSGRTVEFMVGRLASQALEDREVGFFIGASDQKRGIRVESTTRTRGITVGVVRMPSAAKAAGAVTDALRGREPNADAKTPEKKSIAIPGYDKAIAYTQAYPTGNPNVAFVAHEQYVIFAYGAYSPEQIQKYFDAQIKGLDSFRPTPTAKFTELPVDESGMARYTLPPSTDDPTRTGTLPRTVAMQSQLDVTASRKAFDDAGVDGVGVGTGTVYRTKDAVAAKRMQQSFVDDVRGHYTSKSTIAVENVPGAVCMTLPMYPGSLVTTSWCIVAVGRYLVEVAGAQQKQSVQRIGAEYLILRDVT